MSFDSDESIAMELAIYLDNEEPLYRKKVAIAANLAKKIARGTYNHKQAPQAWSYVVEDAAKAYVKEFGSGGKRKMVSGFPSKNPSCCCRKSRHRWYETQKMVGRTKYKRADSVRRGAHKSQKRCSQSFATVYEPSLLRWRST